MTETITPAARFYRLHRDEQLAKKKLEYQNRPDVIAKREERERKKAEKALEKELAKLAEKAAKQAEKDRKVQERVEIAIKTKRKIKKVTD